MASLNVRFSTLAGCLLIASLICSQETEAVGIVPRKSHRPSGWTLNSIGYNGGLGALRKLFGKRDGTSVDTEEDELVSDVNINEGAMNELVHDFVEFLKLKASGRLGPEVLRCILVNMQEQGEEEPETVAE
ncbi:uncharacterized protein LOC143446430 [Clavelina lepadiformis]|uniref:uncharacterized protein LOC143446430 n=1 Tax=Clavelina lepadiformis TaxID=159417 RepID=UPI0040418C9F